MGMADFEVVHDNAMFELKMIKDGKYKIMEDREKQIEDAIKIVGPVASMVGLSEDDTKIIIEYVDKMSKRGCSGKQAGTMLRNYLKEVKR